MNLKTIKFSAEAKRDLIPAWKDYVHTYRKENFSTKKTISTAKSLSQKECLVNKMAHAEITKFSNVQSSVINDGQYVTNPMYRWAFFAVVNTLIDAILPDVVSEDFYHFSNVTTVGRGNTATFNLKSADLFEVSTNGSSRRHVNAQRQFTGTKTLTPVDHTITTQVDLYRVMAGEESLAEYAMKVILSIENEIAIDIAYAMQDSFGTLSDNFKEVGFTQDAFQELALKISSVNGNKAIALGTEIGLSKVLPESDYLKMGLGQDYVKIGYLPVFMNTPLITLAQAIDWSSVDYDFAIDNDYIYFVSPATQKLIQVVFDDAGLTIADDIFKNGDLTQNVSLHKGWNCALITNAHHGVMKLK